MAILKSDGNGGFIIPKQIFTLIMMLIALLSCVGTVVAYTVTIKADVNWLKEEFNTAGPRHTSTINELQGNIDTNQKIIIQNQERIISMKEDITEIKTDLKGLIAK